MKDLILIMSLCVDVPLAIYFYKKGFVERSNMSKNNKRYFVYMLVVIGITVFMLKTGNYTILASVITSIPAIIAILIISLLGIAMFRFKRPWR